MKNRSKLNQNPDELLLKELRLLFELVSPQELRENLLELYFHFLIHCDKNVQPEHLSSLSETSYLLQAFLKKAKELTKTIDPHEKV